jgi:radical SAM protein with 4Fe4S-binding SPASM domain
MRMSDFLTQLAVEPTNACNLSCVMCPYHSDSYKDMEVGPYQSSTNFEYLPEDTFRRLIDEAASHNCNHLQPQYRGEPFMYKPLMDVLEYAIDKGMKYIMFPTNGTLITDERAKRIVDMGLYMLQFSVDALSKDLYLSIRKNSDFEKVTGAISAIRRYRDEAGKKYPIIGMNFVDTEDVRAERNDYIHHYLEIADFVRVGIGLSYFELHEMLPSEFFAVDEDWRPPCRLILDQIMVTSDGTATLCHTDSTRSHIIGDVNKQSLEEIYNGDAVNEIREAHLDDRFELEVCRDCQIWKADVFRELPSWDPSITVTGSPMWMQYYRTEQPPAAPTQSMARKFASRVKNKIARTVHK